MAAALRDAGVPILGTSVDSIDVAEDRERFSELVTRLNLQQPRGATARSLDEALAAAEKVGFPLMMRPSFVLGGRAMRVVYSPDEIRQWLREGVSVSHDRPILLDSFLQNAIEVDVDAVCDGKSAVVSGVMEHIERAGIHSGDSSCCLPPQTLSAAIIKQLKDQAIKLALELKVIGLINVQFAVTKDNQIYILEANPRASRTVPFVSKATGVAWAKLAARLMLGQTISELGIHEVELKGVCAVKACVFPFSKFPGVDTILGPEMKSTGEVMGIHSNFAGAFAKSQFAAKNILPQSGKVFLSVMNDDKPELLQLAKKLSALGFELVATHGTAAMLRQHGLQVEMVNKVRQGSPHVVDMLGRGEISLVINTPEGSGPALDSRTIRIVANELGVPTFTTIAAASAGIDAIAMVKSGEYLKISALQDVLGMHAD